MTLHPISDVLIREAKTYTEEERTMWVWEQRSGSCGHHSRIAGSHWKLEKAKNTISSNPSEKAQHCQNLDFNSKTLILNFWPPNFERINFKLVISYSSYRKLIHLPCHHTPALLNKQRARENCGDVSLCVWFRILLHRKLTAQGWDGVQPIGTLACELQSLPVMLWVYTIHCPDIGSWILPMSSWPQSFLLSGTTGGLLRGGMQG